MTTNLTTCPAGAAGRGAGGAGRRRAVARGVAGRDGEREREGARDKERERCNERAREGGRGRGRGRGREREREGVREGWREGRREEGRGKEGGRGREWGREGEGGREGGREGGAVLLNGLPCSILIRRPARAARSVKQRGAAVDALKAHKHKIAPSTSALALAGARPSTVSTIMDACDECWMSATV